MDKYNKDRVVFAKMPESIQRQLKAAPASRIDVDNPPPFRVGWTPFKDYDKPRWWPDLAYRVRPSTKKKTVKVAIGESASGFWYSLQIKDCVMFMDGYVGTRDLAIAKARKFLDSIGYTCTIKRGTFDG